MCWQESASRQRRVSPFYFQYTHTGLQHEVWRIFPGSLGFKDYGPVTLGKPYTYFNVI